MANPTPNEVNEKTAPAAKPATAAKAPEPAASAAPESKPAAKAEPAESMRFRVLKAITLDDGRTVMPGEELEIAADDPSWPARRPRQLTRQKYLRPMNDAARDATQGSDDDA